MPCDHESTSHLEDAVRRGVVAALALLVAGVPAAGTVVVPTDVGELARDADAIVRGHVVALRAQWIDDRQSIETIVTMDAETYLKGDWGSSPHFRVPGGQIGRYRRIVVGAPEFAPGQHVIVFLGSRSGSVPHLLGLGQGVFRVVRGGDGWVVTPPAVLGGAPGPIVRGDPRRRPASLSDFERTVRALAAVVP
jgi:hypothetical protein